MFTCTSYSAQWINAACIYGQFVLKLVDPFCLWIFDYAIIAFFWQLHVTKVRVGLQTEPLMQHLSYLTHKQHVTDVAQG